jgi:hypothetical protein
MRGKNYLFTHLDDKSAFYGKRGQSHKTKAAASQVEKPKKEETPLREVPNQ